MNTTQSRLSIVHGPVNSDFIGGPFVCFLVETAGYGGKRKVVGSTSFIQTADHCNDVALRMSRDYDATIETPMLGGAAC